MTEHNENLPEEEMVEEQKEETTPEQEQDAQPGKNEEQQSDAAYEPESSAKSNQIILASEILPDTLPILPISVRPIFPGMKLPLVMEGKRLRRTIEKVQKSENKVAGAVFVKNYEEADEEGEDSLELYDYGTVVRLERVSLLEEGAVQLVVEGVRRFRKKKVRAEDPVIYWDVEYFYEEEEDIPEDEIKAYTLAIISSVKELLKMNPLFQEQLKMLISHISYDEPSKVIDLIASMTTTSPEKLQDILETIPLIRRAEKLMIILREEIELSKLQEKIKQNIEEKISKQQKEFFLREQLKEIKRELGIEKDDKTSETEKFEERLKKRKLSPEAQKVYKEELEKFQALEPSSPEYNVQRTYLDWLTTLPWGIFSEENYDIKKAEEILDESHYGLEDVKDRILEFISTIIKNKRMSATILCLVGPPGVGKTSVGKSIADALGRKFYRFSVGGMRDEAEIKGHRRTYIGALPGKFLQSLKRLNVSNPVLMLDEIDKIGVGFRGDPASALLEVLDPEQNQEFLDHYLDVRFDLSNVLFVTTANQLDTIPPALLDRMEVIKLSGYVLEEKVAIAKRHLIPSLLEKHGLKQEDVSFTDEALKFIIDGYAREAGVRNFENRLKKILRRITRKHAEGDESFQEIDEAKVKEYLRQPTFPKEELYHKNVSGVALGLAWTSMGGATLYVEAAASYTKKGGFRHTGQLGKVMEESCEIAYSFARSQAQRWGIDPSFFEENFIHLHVPAGATPKDGPSAGITMATALYSLAKQKPFPNNFAMTGELTLSGKVLPVGGIKEKIIAAKRVGVKDVILPKENEKDYIELADYLKEGINCHFVDYYQEVVDLLFPEESS